MKKLCVFLALIVFFVAGAVYAEPTTTESDTTVEVSEIDADWTYSSSCMMYGRDGMGVRMDWILFVPGEGWEVGTLGCYVAIKNGSDSGPIIYYAQASDLASGMAPFPIYYHGAKIRPVIDFSASSVGHDSSKVIFQLWPQQ